MKEEGLVLQAADGAAQTFVYAPDGGPHPGLLFYTDIWGIRPGNQAMARRIAAAGYTVMMPNVFYRYGALPLLDFEPVIGDPRTMQAMAGLMAALTGAAMERDAPHYVKALLARDDVRGPKIAAVGYCFTGALALRTAAAEADMIAAAASFHGGRLVTDDTDSPHTRIPHVKGELYFGHAVQDPIATPAQIAVLDDTLKGWGGVFQSQMYDGAKHGWTMPGRDIYNQVQAERAHARLMDLLARTIG